MVRNLRTWAIFLGAAFLEVAGDATVKKGFYTPRHVYVVFGFIMLGAYGMLVNSLNWEFSRLLGVYVAVFALVSVAAGRFSFQEVIPPSTWLGLGFIILGGLIIQFVH